MDSVPLRGSDKQWSVASDQWKRKKGTREELNEFRFNALFLDLP